jgi:hypothetical protein
LSQHTEGLSILVQRADETKHDPGEQVVYRDSWSYTNPIPLDIHRNYEFSIWSKTDDKNVLKNYFGFFVYDKDMEYIRTGDWENPYFYSSDGNTASHGEWTKKSGKLLASRDSVPLDGGKARLAQSTGLYHFDYVMPPNAAFVSLRYGCAYGGGEGTVLGFKLNIVLGKSKCLRISRLLA